MRHSWKSLSKYAACAIAAAAALAAHDGRACDMMLDDSDHVPHAVYFQGVVEHAAPGKLRVGEATVVIPDDPMSLPWMGSDDDDGDTLRDTVYYARVHEGDLVDVYGMLRTDGTVLAYSVELDGYVDMPSAGPPVAGVCEASDAASVTVGGRVVEISDSVTDVEGLRDYWRNEPHRYVLPGDAVAMSTFVGDDGHLIAGDLTVRQSGEGTSLGGTIGGWDAENEDLTVDGVTVHVDEYTCVDPHDGPAYYDEEDDWDYSYFDDVADGARPPVEGRWARVDGILRNGVVLADRVVISGASDAPAKRARARKPGWMRLKGVVTSAQPRTVAVNDLSVQLGRASRHALPVGTRVRVDARLLPGAIQARTLRRR